MAASKRSNPRPRVSSSSWPAAMAAISAPAPDGVFEIWDMATRGAGQGCGGGAAGGRRRGTGGRGRTGTQGGGAARCGGREPEQEEARTRCRVVRRTRAKKPDQDAVYSGVRDGGGCGGDSEDERSTGTFF